MSGQISCACFDLETTNLSADFGVLLCAVIKPAYGESFVIRADQFPTWKTHRSDDRGILKAVTKVLDDFDIWIAHNGARFDVPFLRTRLLTHGLPPLPSKKLIDPLLLARNKLRMSYNSLKQLANHLGCNTKTELQPKLWLRAALDGDTKAMNAIVDHCERDVETLDKVAGALKVYSSTYNNYGSGF